MEFGISAFDVKHAAVTFCLLIALTVIFASISCKHLKTKKKAVFKLDICLILYHTAILIMNLVSTYCVFKNVNPIVVGIPAIIGGVAIMVSVCFRDFEGESFDEWCENFRHKTIRGFMIVFSVYLVYNIILVLSMM